MSAIPLAEGCITIRLTYNIKTHHTDNHSGSEMSDEVIQGAGDLEATYVSRLVAGTRKNINTVSSHWYPLKNKKIQSRRVHAH